MDTSDEKAALRNIVSDSSRKALAANAPTDGWYELKTKNFNKELNRHRLVSQEEDKHRKNGEEQEMTNATKESIIGAKFDFATLSGCISDIRKGFWNIERVNDFYKNKLK